MRVVLGSDHGGYETKLVAIEYLKENNIDFVDLGCYSKDSVDYSEYGIKVAEMVRDNIDTVGIVVCTTGIGISIVANKVKGVRAALCNDPYAAKMTRLHNDANVLALGGGMIGKNMAIDILETFLNTEFSEGENHIRRIGLIEQD